LGHQVHKSNFSQPFFTFWDRSLNTMWRGGDVKLRYEKSRADAEAWWEEQKKLAEATGHANGKANGHANGTARGPSTSAVDDVKPPAAKLRQSPRKKTSSSAAAQAGSLKGLTERVSGSLPNGVPRVDSTR
jgi:sphinganine C4-monooxygenase